MGSNDGRGTPAQVSDSIDLTRRSDRKLALASIKRRWDTDEQLRADMVDAVRWGIETGRAGCDLQGVRGYVQLGIAMEAQNQTDEHLKEKLDRADEGKADSVVEVRVVRVEKPRTDVDG